MHFFFARVFFVQKKGKAILRRTSFYMLNRTQCEKKWKKNDLKGRIWWQIVSRSNICPRWIFPTSYFLIKLPRVGPRDLAAWRGDHQGFRFLPLLKSQGPVRGEHRFVSFCYPEDLPSDLCQPATEVARTPRFGIHSGTSGPSKLWISWPSTENWILGISRDSTP